MKHHGFLRGHWQRATYGEVARYIAEDPDSINFRRIEKARLPLDLRDSYLYAAFDNGDGDRVDSAMLNHVTFNQSGVQMPWAPHSSMDTGVTGTTLPPVWDQPRARVAHSLATAAGGPPHPADEHWQPAHPMPQGPPPPPPPQHHVQFFDGDEDMPQSASGAAAAASGHNEDFGNSAVDYYVENLVGGAGGGLVGLAGVAATQGPEAAADNGERCVCVRRGRVC